MKAKDLRKSNIVDWYGEMAVISQLWECEVVLKCGETTLYEDLKPIPIIDEWLKKLGFKETTHFGLEGPIMELCSPEHDDPRPKEEPETDEEDSLLYHHGTCYWSDNMLRVDYSNEYGEYATIHMPNIRYIHQLQNLFFSLTGEELRYEK